MSRPLAFTSLQCGSNWVNCTNHGVVKFFFIIMCTQKTTLKLGCSPVGLAPTPTPCQWFCAAFWIMHEKIPPIRHREACQCEFIGSQTSCNDLSHSYFFQANVGIFVCVDIQTGIPQVMEIDLSLLSRISE